MYKVTIYLDGRPMLVQEGATVNDCEKIYDEIQAEMPEKKLSHTIQKITGFFGT